jgi:hypothetical protein
MNADQATGQDTAIEERPELALHELRHPVIFDVLRGEERLQFPGNNLIKKAALRSTRSTVRSSGVHRPGICITKSLVRLSLLKGLARHVTQKSRKHRARSPGFPRHFHRFQRK